MRIGTANATAATSGWFIPTTCAVASKFRVGVMLVREIRLTANPERQNTLRGA